MLNLFQHPSGGPLCANRLVMNKQPCMYMLASQPRGTLYVGVTSDLPARLYKHRSRATSGFTSRYGVLRLVRYEMFGDMTAARAREKQLKRWHRSWKINLIEQDNPQWVDLAIGLGFEPLPPRGREDGP
jgi:putative endonuclease